MRHALLLLLLVLFASSALAKDGISDRTTFLNLVLDKTLSLQLFRVRLYINEDGTIQGKGMGRPVRGFWEWQDGYFCRTLIWGNVDLGRNCQGVTIENGKRVFTSDRGTGASAKFSLN